VQRVPDPHLCSAITPYGPENLGRAALIENAFSRFEAYNATKTAELGTERVQ